jgi:transposase
MSVANRVSPAQIDGSLGARALGVVSRQRVGTEITHAQIRAADGSLARRLGRAEQLGAPAEYDDLLERSGSRCRRRALLRKRRKRRR